jgi:hypothetical protein
VTAIKTPYLPDGRVDLFSYDCLVEQQIAAGVEGLIVGGTTGEGHLMSWDEHIMLIAHTANRCAACLARAALSRCACACTPLACAALRMHAAHAHAHAHAHASALR